MGWTTITKDQIKSVPVGSKIKVCGVTTTLVDHYGGKDFGFEMEHEVEVKGCPYTSGIFCCSDWEANPTIEVWKEEECLSLEEAIKAFEEKHNITIKDWEENSKTIPLGQVMRVGKDGFEELVMLVQVDHFKYNLMCLVEGNRLLRELKITRLDGGVFNTKEIEKVSGWKIIELLENPFGD